MELWPDLKCAQRKERLDSKGASDKGEHRTTAGSPHDSDSAREEDGRRRNCEPNALVLRQPESGIESAIRLDQLMLPIRHPQVLVIRGHLADRGTQPRKEERKL